MKTTLYQCISFYERYFLEFEIVESIPKADSEWGKPEEIKPNSYEYAKDDQGGIIHDPISTFDYRYYRQYKKHESEFDQNTIRYLAVKNPNALDDALDFFSNNKKFGYGKGNMPALKMSGLNEFKRVVRHIMCRP